MALSPSDLAKLHLQAFRLKYPPIVSVYQGASNEHRPSSPSSGSSAPPGPSLSPGAPVASPTANSTSDPFEGAGTSLTDRTIQRHAPQLLTRWQQARVFAIWEEELVGRHLPVSNPELGEIVAWRAWDVREDGELESLGNTTRWPPGQTISGVVEDYGACGVHAFKTPQDAAKLAVSYHSHVWGEVLLWGNVIEHENGYRAEFAKPLSLNLTHLPWPLARKVERAYGPVGVRVLLPARAPVASPLLRAVATALWSSLLATALFIAILRLLHSLPS